eukprot:3837386-Prymnesium_polylepis.1
MVTLHRRVRTQPAHTTPVPDRNPTKPARDGASAMIARRCSDMVALVLPCVRHGSTAQTVSHAVGSSGGQQIVHG